MASRKTVTPEGQGATHEVVLSQALVDNETDKDGIPSCDLTMQCAGKSQRDTVNKVHMNICKLQLDISPTFEQKFIQPSLGVDISEGIFLHGNIADMKVNFWFIQVHLSQFCHLRTVVCNPEARIGKEQCFS